MIIRHVVGTQAWNTSLGHILETTLYLVTKRDKSYPVTPTKIREAKRTI
jgi:hypothetical protein